MFYKYVAPLALGNGVAATRQSAAVWDLVSGGLPTRRYGAGKTGVLLCVSTPLVSQKSDGGGWRLGAKICRGRELRSDSFAPRIAHMEADFRLFNFDFKSNFWRHFYPGGIKRTPFLEMGRHCNRRHGYSIFARECARLNQVFNMASAKLKKDFHQTRAVRIEAPRVLPHIAY